MILHKTFGQHLRLGNLLFKYAWTRYAQMKYACSAAFPDHYLWKYLENGPMLDFREPVEKVFKCQKWEYDPIYVNSFKDDFRHLNVDIDLACFFQSAKWFEGNDSYIRDTALEFKPEYVNYIKNKYWQSLSKTTIAISIRRGDFVNHGCFYQIPVEFYLKALSVCFPERYSMNIILFSDDIEWCKKEFVGPNIYYAEPNGTNADPSDKDNYHRDPVEQLVYMSLCDHFIIGNSTFSWWGAFLGKNPNKKVIHSGKVFDGEYLDKYDTSDYYHPDWIKLDFNFDYKS